MDLGTFYNGHKTTMAYSRGRVEMTPQLSLEPTFSVNWVELEEGSFTATLVGSRVTYTVTPLMFVSALVQYNASGSVASANARFRWEYQPGSELFVVFNEERDTREPFPDRHPQPLVHRQDQPSVPLMRLESGHLVIWSLICRFANQ